MLRRLLLYLSTAGWARRIATDWGLARRVARRFVAGETLDEAIAVARTLNQSGIQVTLDYLGESIHKAEESAGVRQTYLELLDCIANSGIQASISLKLTHLGLDIGETLGIENVRQIVQAANERSIGVTIDMESSAYTQKTLDIYRTIRDDAGYQNVGTVIQSYLRRSEKDMRELAAENAHIRLCKGAYLEPSNIAYPDKADVDASFVRLTDAYLAAGTDAYLCIATHDEAMIQAALASVKQHEVPSDRYEFQMLYGIRSNRQQELADAGHTVRIYVPFGSTWYPYFMRRLAERPANLTFFLRGFFGQ